MLILVENNYIFFLIKLGKEEKKTWFTQRFFLKDNVLFYGSPAKLMFWNLF